MWVYEDALQESETNSRELTDYKFFCFNGNVDCVMVCIDKQKGDLKYYFFDKDWHLLRYNIRGKNAPENFILPKPDSMDEMFRIAGILLRDKRLHESIYITVTDTFFSERLHSFLTVDLIKIFCRKQMIAGEK